MKTRVFPESNYKGIYFNGKTMRIALDPSKPISDLDFPEFYDVKITEICDGKCPYCYMDSYPESDSSFYNCVHAFDLIGRIKKFFGSMSDNEKPFQVAIGGGEPTMHPDFIKCLGTLCRMGITPNYTTNGMFIKDPIKSTEILYATKKYCGGVAISCHPHLDEYWRWAALAFYGHYVKLNFHIIISDKESVDRFREIYDEWFNKVDYFVLLPYGEQGRAAAKEIDWDYLVERAPEDTSKCAFGANFHSYLVENPGPYKNVSLYEPEAMSQYVDLVKMKLYPSSFHLQPIKDI